MCRERIKHVLSIVLFCAGLRRLAKERPDYIVAVHPDTGDDSYGSDGFIALLMTPWMTSQLQELGRFLMFDTAFKLIAGHYTMFGIVLNIDQPFTKSESLLMHRFELGDIPRACLVFCLHV